jgi:hypothetical protein
MCRQRKVCGTHVRLEARRFQPTENAEGRRGIIGVMNDVTQILSQIESGDPSAAEQLLPLVHEELRKLAAAKLAQEKPGQTLQATSLVHEAYIRLVDTGKDLHWNSLGHFFAAAAEAMRRTLIVNARRRCAERRSRWQSGYSTARPIGGEIFARSMKGIRTAA